MLQRPWQVHLLGTFSVCQGDRVVSRFRTRKTASLLAYLAYHIERPHTRDELADLFWPDDDPSYARGSLRTALNSLRKQLEGPAITPGSILMADRATVGLNPHCIEIDAGVFMRAIKDWRANGARMDLLERAAAFYCGELLSGFYDDWIIRERRRLADEHMEALRTLIDAYVQAGDLSRALAHANALVAADPLLEDSHVTLMRIYKAMGRPLDAAKQFDELTGILRQSLDVEPSREACALAETIEPRLPSTRLASGSHAPVSVSHPSLQSDGVRMGTTRVPSLPVPLTPFFGRESEMERLLEQLSRSAANPADGIRLLTLVGPGGIGKTRLSVEVARRISSAFDNAVWFVPIVDISDSDAIPNSILSALGVKESANGSWVESARKQIGDRPGLIVLDNLEHLQASAANYIHELLASIPSLVCLATSRARLGVDGERSFPLIPLALPDQAIDSPAELAEFACVRLFVDRAQASRPDFQLLESNASSIAEICRRMEGLPLALELAASWAHMLTVKQMLERTEQRIGLVASGRRWGVERHRSLRATIGWSYRLLEPVLQSVFRRLSVFRGGFDILAAAAVCGAGLDLESDILLQLTMLAEFSLIMVQEICLERGSQMRYRMLDSRREYGAELMDTEEKNRTYSLHADHYLARAEAWNAGKKPIPIDLLEAELDNLRAALDWCTHTPGYHEKARRLAVAMIQMYEKLLKTQVDSASHDLTDRMNGLAQVLEAAGMRKEGARVRRKLL